MRLSGGAFGSWAAFSRCSRGQNRRFGDSFWKRFLGLVHNIIEVIKSQISQQQDI